MRAPAPGPNLPATCAADSPPPAEVKRREPAPASAVMPTRDGTTVEGPLSREAAREARRQDLLHRARAEDVLHWQQHQRPISAETLRKRLAVGTGTARGLVTQLRADTHGALDGRSNRPTSEARVGNRGALFWSAADPPARPADHTVVPRAVPVGPSSSRVNDDTADDGRCGQLAGGDSSDGSSGVR